MKKRREVRGSYTVETALIMPVIMSVLVLSISLTFYYYDKCILTGIASETAITASEKIRCGKSTSEIQQSAERTTGKRLLFFSGGTASVKRESDRITVVIKAAKKTLSMRCTVKASSCCGEAEKYIRLYRMVKKDD